MRKLIFCLVTALPAYAAGHNPLLPRPQEVHYAAGALALDGLAIRFAAPPSAEDRFAAGQLSSGLSQILGAPVPVEGTRGAGQAIVLRRTAEAGVLPAPSEQSGPDSRESYTISVTPRGAEVRAPSSAGLFYAAQTLVQLAEGRGAAAALPAVEIRDWPTLAYRGFMMDLGHGQLLKVEEIERQIDLLARFKANQYYFYSEATIELDGYALVNPHGRYTQDQVRRIIAYARERHIDVVPCLELYGHLHDIFRVERFSSLSLPRYGGEFDPRNPRVAAVLDDLVDQTTELFPSPWYHVGFDEPWALGKLGTTPGADPFKAYIDVLRHVAQRVQARNKRMMFWADMLSGARIFSKHPELISDLPPGTIAVPWVYEARADFSPYVKPLADAKVSTVVAPGVWNWNELFPDYHRTFRNINGLVAEGVKRGTLGILNTGWTDSAQTIYRMSAPGLAMGAVAGWQAAPLDAASFFKEYAQVVYPAAAAPEIAFALEELSDAQEIFSKTLGSSTIRAMWADPLEPARVARIEAGEAELRKARLQAEAADEHLQLALRKGADRASLNSLLLGARLLDYLGMKSLYVLEWARYFRRMKENPDAEIAAFYIDTQILAQDHGMLADLMDAISGLRERYREAWLEESTSYRMGTALARFDAECEYWRAMQARSGELARLRKAGQPALSLEALRPKP